MKGPFKKLLVPFTAFAVLLGAPEARCNELLNLTPGQFVTVRIPEAINGGFTGFIANPEIADVYYGPKNVFIFVGKKVGTTNFVAIGNDNGGELYRVTLDVGGLVGGHPLHVYHSFDDISQYICNSSNCDLLEGVGGPAAKPAADNTAANSPPASPAGLQSEGAAGRPRRGHAPLGIAVSPDGGVGVAIPLYPRNTAPPQ